MSYRVHSLVVVLMGFVGHLQAADVVFNAGGFEGGTAGEVPVDWAAFPRTAKPSVKLVKTGANGSRQSLRGERSESGGLTALARKFESPQQRVMIEFSFAFSKTSGRSLNIWTHESKGQDASQLNLCIQGGALMQFDGRTRTWEEITRKIEPTVDPVKPVWHRLRAIVDSKQPGIDYWISEPNGREFPDSPITRQVYRTDLTVGAIALVSGRRIAPKAWYLIDDLQVTGGQDVPAPHKVKPLPVELALWTGAPIPRDLAKIPFVPGMRHQTIHRAAADGYRFLHGAAIVHHKGTLYANWANSPTHENGPHETLQGRKSTDGGKTWSDVEVIAPGFKGDQRHSHGMLFVHKDELWTICARWGAGTTGSRFLDLKGEAFVLNERSGKWKSRGIVMDNCWPYDQPMRMENGNFITGGQDKDGLPVVAISRGDDMTKWDSVLIPYDLQLKPIYAETTVWGDGDRVIAVIRGGLNVAWVATSDDFGRTWSKARPSKMPMPRSKAYLGKLSTGQRYMLSNLVNRDTLIVSVSKPGEKTLSKMWRIRHGKSAPPRVPGKGKFKQWSYPYGYEHDGKLFVVYSIGKEDCGLSVLPIESLAHGAVGDKADGDRVFWQAHRGGGAKDAPDNTMAAFRYTWDLGGIPEADIRTTADGVVICLHDRTLSRTTTAPKDVRGKNVKTLTFEEIRKWDAGVKLREEFKGQRVPALEEVFTAMKEDPLRQVYLDIKAVDLKVLGELIDQYGVNKQVLIASPRQSDCQTLKKITKGLRTMIWIGGSPTDIKRRFAAVVDANFAGVDQVQLHLHDKKGNNPFRYQLERDFLASALQKTHDANVDLEVFPFRFDDTSLQELLDIGIRWFATDEPKRFKQTIFAWREKKENQSGK